MSIVVRDQALIDSVKRGDVASVEALLDAGADPDAADLLDGLSALHHAQAGGHVRIARLLRECGARPLEPDAPPVAPPAEPPRQPERPPPTPPANRPWWAGPLMAYYVRDGYVRRPQNPAPAAGREEDWEVRFLGSGKGSFGPLQELLAKAGFACREPQRRPRGWMLVVPGRAAVERVVALWKEMAKMTLT